MNKKIIIVLTILLSALAMLSGCDNLINKPQSSETANTAVDDTSKEEEPNNDEQNMQSDDHQTGKIETDTQSPQQGEKREEILSSDATKSIVLGLVRSLERETNVKATKKTIGDDYTEDVIFLKT